MSKIYKLTESKLKNIIKNVLKESVDEIAAYHGSPSLFDVFDTTMMSSGEGHQAHGWGIYVAVDPKTGIEYATKLARDGFGYWYALEVAEGNYIEEEDEIDEDEMYNILNRLEEAYPYDFNDYVYDMIEEGNGWINWRLLYKYLCHYAFNDNAEMTSKALYGLGYKGIHYYGRQDGECYVVFNPDDVKVLYRKKMRQIADYT